VPSELTDHRQLSPTVNQYLPGKHEPFRVISKQNIFFTESYSILVPFRQERTRIPPKEPVIIISLELAFAYLYMPVISLSRHLTQASYSVSHQVVPFRECHNCQLLRERLIISPVWDLVGQLQPVIFTRHCAGVTVGVSETITFWG
jgi:hypothetical protein